MEADLSKVVTELLRSRTGAEIRYSDRLSIVDAASGLFVVRYQSLVGEPLGAETAFEYLYDDPVDAVERFLTLRQTLRLGLDYDNPVRHYDPSYGDHSLCSCQHTYMRHFDGDTGQPIQCERCSCQQFHPQVSRAAQKPSRARKRR